MSVKKDLQKASNLMDAAGSAKRLEETQQAIKSALASVASAKASYVKKKKSIPTLLINAYKVLTDFKKWAEAEMPGCPPKTVERVGGEYVKKVIKATHVAEKEIKAS